MMDRESLEYLLTAVHSGEVTIDEAFTRLSHLPFADLGDSRIDHHRALRQGMPEAIYAPGKTPEQCVRIVRELYLNGTGPIVLTRTDEAQRNVVLAEFPDATISSSTLLWRAAAPRNENVSVITAGTADWPVAEECITTLSAYGFKANFFADCGVAGVHRLVANLTELQHSDAVIVIAGMEGALASVVGGLISAPIIAVPTSVGYGASLEGVTALLAMLSSCAPGITVVGIDNGYGAACAVARILHND
jgi:NCAIR mutase (PurE)-related protein